VADSDAGRGGWKKQRLHCNDADTGLCLITKVSPLPTGLSLRESLKNFIKEEKQMTISNEISASSDSALWQSINWKAVEANVLKLQMRIAKATRDGKHGKAKALQWILTHSRSAKLLAVKRVSQNKGSKTPGIDGVVWNTDSRRMKAVNQLSRKAYQAKPLRRIYIPKKNGKLRPLGIPCMIDRAQQALHLLSLEPISETTADPNSYGFRANRSTADAVDQCFKCLALKKSAKWLMDNIAMDKRMLEQWLKSGFVDKGLFTTPMKAHRKAGSFPQP
jgi:RNA-directed DNA polymerase